MAMRRTFRSTNTEYFDQANIPKKFREELDAVLENVEAIHGPRFAQHVKFVINIKSLLGIIIMNSKRNEDVEEENFKEVLTDITTQLAGSHGDACGLNQEQIKEAFNTTNAIDGIVEHLRNEMMEQRRKK